MSVQGRARHAMTQRAVVQRDSQAGVDTSGDPSDTWAAIAGSPVPCRKLKNVKRAVLDEGNQRYLENLIVMMPLGTDITEADRVLKITDRKATPTKLYGKTDDDGTTDIPMTIDAIEREEDHLTVWLRQEGSGPRTAL